MKSKPLLYWAASLSMFALVTHAIDAKDHLTEWWLYGTLFVIAASFQFFYGMALFLRPWRYDETGGIRDNPDIYGRPFYLLGIVLAGFVMVLYVITRTSGLPFFGEQAKALPITPLSLLPSIEDVPLIYCLALLLYRTRPASRYAEPPPEQTKTN